jgi:hypothetical protein
MLTSRLDERSGRSLRFAEEVPEKFLIGWANGGLQDLLSHFSGVPEARTATMGS